MKNGVNPLRRVLAQVTLFLPLLLLSALTLASFLLYQIAPVDETRLPAQSAGKDPDFYVEQFAARQYDVKGNLLTEIFGHKAVHYPVSRRLEITQLKLSGINQDGHYLTARANQAVTNEDRSDVHLAGDAQVSLMRSSTTPARPPVEFFSEKLHLMLGPKILVSEVPVRVVQGQNTFSSASMHYDHAAQVLSLRGKVRLTLFPKKS